ncbi:hypothetical protein DFJ43DRAFT_671041 [Lentinula guzmanii]|uniref:Uncharacterized protein n=1 Tax=Lentinula guzmanii TaxID=2804957 RepID=A0AA38JJV7_9AGAR|nr:hypothetical protein DFJ43DRAFT_671041 [Lentinula guzmanii]
MGSAYLSISQTKIDSPRASSFGSTMRLSIPFLSRSPTRSSNTGPRYHRLNDQEDSGGVEEAQDEHLETDNEVFTELSVTRILRALRRKALVFFVVLILVILVVVVATKTRGNESEDDEDGPVLDDDSEHIADDARLEKYQTPSDAAYCAPWLSTINNDYHNSENSKSIPIRARVSFDISPQSELIFFVSRGQPTEGHFTMTSDPFARIEKITVNVTAEYDDWRDLERTKVCFIDNDQERGIMIWAGDNVPSLSPTFKISVEIPWSRFQDLSTDFSAGSYTQNLGDFFDIWNPVGFGIVRLKGRNEAINSLGLFVESAFFRTTNAPVSASFFSNDAVHIRTTNAPIESMVWAIGSHEEAITEVSLRTNDASIRAALTMVSDFNVVKLNAALHTTNGELNITMPRMAVLGPEYTFALDASTSNAASDVYLSPDYAGTFDLQTKHNGKTHVQYKDASDPWGKGRKHVLEMEVDSERRKSGKVYWGNEVPKTMGAVRVKTTERDVWLYTSPD